MNSRIAKALIFSIVSLTPACLSDCTSPTSPEDVPCPPGIKPGIQVLYAFEDRYPNAEDVAWDMEGNYYVATFTLLSAPANAWFDESGEWLLSLTEYAFEQLSYSIPEALSNSNYADWKVQHVNLLERMSMGHIYVIKVTDCAKYVDLYYSRLGDLIRVQQTHAANYLHYPVIIPP
ncbi:MAG: PepSY-like domain-containing protein, partial [Tannerellaceae bacterium]|nr:PepSY-like domain-containing protein [Tannerellaceae bacterium]